MTDTKTDSSVFKKCDYQGTIGVFFSKSSIRVRLCDFCALQAVVFRFRFILSVYISNSAFMQVAL